MWRLAGCTPHQPGAHHLVEGSSKLGGHHADIGASDRQRLVLQEGPEHRQGAVLDDFRAPGINPLHKLCRERGTASYPPASMQTRIYLCFCFLEASLAKISETAYTAPVKSTSDGCLLHRVKAQVTLPPAVEETETLQQFYHLLQAKGFQTQMEGVALLLDLCKNSPQLISTNIVQNIFQVMGGKRSFQKHFKFLVTQQHLHHLLSIMPKEGRKEGREKGREEGRKEGRKEGNEKGQLVALVFLAAVNGNFIIKARRSSATHFRTWAWRLLGRREQTLGHREKEQQQHSLGQSLLPVLAGGRRPGLSLQLSTPVEGSVLRSHILHHDPQGVTGCFLNKLWGVPHHLEKDWSNLIHLRVHVLLQGRKELSQSDDCRVGHLGTQDILCSPVEQQANGGNSTDLLQLEHCCRARLRKGCSQIFILSLLCSGFTSALWPSGLSGLRGTSQTHF
ncbi:hypothetical protein DV515_00016342 [Chloebia gouldiae]|uniref:Uncharacterized protein n=1 Tax=Chloebia gouldiae TaxID=44316 RepID=A0A3L8RSN7_CHLGU|nr:hypothetical protein DV515_00016342 [Chloebia gouldiae]